MAKKPRKNGALRTWKSYNFVDKDPIIDVVRTARSDSHMTYRQVEEEGGPTATTLRKWEMGKTRQPYFATVSAALNAMGVRGIEYGPKGKPKILK